MSTFPIWFLFWFICLYTSFRIQFPILPPCLWLTMHIVPWYFYSLLFQNSPSESLLQNEINWHANRVQRAWRVKWKYIFPGRIITWAAEHLCNTPSRCKNLKIKYINSASEIFENYFKFFKSRDFFMTNSFKIIIDAMCYFDASYLKKPVRFEKLFFEISGNGK